MECKRHKWKVGAFIGRVEKKKIVKKGIHIWCWKCKKRIKAYYK